MKIIPLLAASMVLLATGVGGAFAQPRFDPHDDRGRPPIGDHRDERGGEQHEWRRGDRIARDDWNRGGRIDYREHHLRAPPRGYEWRDMGGRYVLAAIATGVIADIILNAR